MTMRTSTPSLRAALALTLALLALGGSAAHAGEMPQADPAQVIAFVGGMEHLASGNLGQLFSGAIGIILLFAVVVLFLSPFIVLFWLTRPSQPGPNQWGPNPQEVSQ